MRAVFVDLLEDLFDRQSVYALAAVLARAGVAAGYACSSRHELLVRRVRELRPDLVLYSSFSHTLPDYARFDAELKKHCDVVSLIGGPGPTFNPTAIDGTTIDAACVGEGDQALVAFVENGFRACAGIRLREDAARLELPPLADLDALPLPDRDIVYARDGVRATLPSKQFVSGRGCPYLCAYCFNHSYNRLVRDCGPVVRKKSVDRLFEEIDRVRAKYPLGLVVFNDDTFILNRRWFFEFCARYPGRVGIPYSCNLRANLVDEEIVRALKQSGCVAVNWSIESGDETLRNAVLRRNISDEQILQTAELLARYKIRHRIGNLIGLPGETQQQMLQTVALNIRARPSYALANIFVPYPGLDLTAYAVEHGHYAPVPERDLPRSYFSHSPLRFPPGVGRWIEQLLYLFPFFVQFPRLFRSRRARELAFRLPKIVLRPLYEVFYGVMFLRVYRVASSPLNTLKFSARHLQSLLHLRTR